MGNPKWHRCSLRGILRRVYGYPGVMRGIIEVASTSGKDRSSRAPCYGGISIRQLNHRVFARVALRNRIRSVAARHCTSESTRRIASTPRYVVVCAVSRRWHRDNWAWTAEMLTDSGLIEVGCRQARTVHNALSGPAVRSIVPRHHNFVAAILGAAEGVNSMHLFELVRMTILRRPALSRTDRFAIFQEDSTTAGSQTVRGCPSSWMTIGNSQGFQSTPKPRSAASCSKRFLALASLACQDLICSASVDRYCPLCATLTCVARDANRRNRVSLMPYVLQRFWRLRDLMETIFHRTVIFPPPSSCSPTWERLAPPSLWAPADNLATAA